jgi:hypothetical protein
MKQRTAVKSKTSLPVVMTEAQVAEIIKKHSGFLTYVAEELNLKLDDLKKIIKKSRELRTILVNTKEMGLDFAESKLMKKISDGNLLAIMFYLKCQGQQRGWIDRPNPKTGSSPDKPLYIKLMPIGED